MVSSHSGADARKPSARAMPPEAIMKAATLRRRPKAVAISLPAIEAGMPTSRRTVATWVGVHDPAARPGWCAKTKTRKVTSQARKPDRSEEHTSEPQSLKRTSDAV